MKRFIGTVLICLIIGVGMAWFVGNLNTQGIIIDDWVTATTTITDLQIGLVSLWIFIGAILGVRQR